MSKLDLVPEFTEDSPVSGMETVQPVKAVDEEPTAVEEKVTPPEPPTEEKPADSEINKPELSVDTSGLKNQLQGLQEERVKLIKEVQELRGQKREIKREELIKVEVDELKDVHPDDVALIDKVLRQKGYLTKEESQKMFYENVKQDGLKEFLEKFPEYKPENDPHDVNWNTLQRELGFYRMPDDPHRVGEVLLRAHQGIQKTPSDRTLEVKKQQVKTAGVGAGGVQKSSSRKTFDVEKRIMLDQGGFSSEDIARMESRL